LSREGARPTDSQHCRAQFESEGAMPDELDADDAASHSSGHTWSVRTITIPWTNPVPDSLNGIIHVLAHNTPIKVDGREALLITIAKARHWIEDLTHGHVASFAAIARCGKPPRRSWSTWSTIRSR